MKLGVHNLAPVVFLFSVGGLTVALTNPKARPLPQVAQGDDVLSVIFGDARAVISRAAVHKADSYFHGGVDMECTEERGHDHARESAAEASDGSPRESGAAAVRESDEQVPDPWRWLNGHIRAPEIERHLEGEKAVELIPWLWAAVRADPHNIDAWTDAIYMSSHAVKDDTLAREVIREAKRANPESLEILFSEGKYLYERAKRDPSSAADGFLSAQSVFEEVRTRALARCDNDPERLEEGDRWVYRFAVNYLAEIVKKRSGK